jgi:alpha/beta superfamily hydrolase
MPARLEVPVSITGPAGRLEAMWCPSESKTATAAVICHPHPLQGGTMDNKVVTTLARTWRDADVPTLRFNFRGTGRSEGLHDEGRGEVDDLRAVLSWLKNEQGVTDVVLAGFSFGAWVAAAAGSSPLPTGLHLRQLVLVAPPVQYLGFDGLQPPAGTLVFQGDADDVVDPEAARAWAASRSLPPVLLRFPDTGHFFHGRLTALKAELSARI